MGTSRTKAREKDVRTMIIASALSNGTSTPGLVEQVQLLILLLIVTLIVALLARLMRVPYTLLLVIVGFLVGIVVGLMPFLPHEHLDPNLVLYIFIPALLFEGVWNAELDRLEAEWLPIILLAIPGMLLSLLVVAFALHVGIHLSWLLALLVGAIVAPTDPVAVIALFQQLGVPDRLRTLVEGESIFNDGTGGAAYELVLAVLLPTLGLAEVAGNPSFQNTPALTNLVQSFPGIFFGVLGALIGRILMIYIFIPLQDVLARWWAHRIPKRSSRLSRPRPIPPAWRPVMVLSGLRGALSLALVLSLPDALAQRNLLTDIVYGVILVTLLGQGLALRTLLPRWKDKLVRAEVVEPLPTKV